MRVYFFKASLLFVCMLYVLKERKANDTYDIAYESKSAIFESTLSVISYAI